ncbi:XRE family transcriptional regulator [Leptolyngbyaceae cyanobacterium CCMR0082]|uniref:XRE family transcriptional regulator n=1 Tax=Adonisia turfae CCMR0082 TaxID=2304604 RepID=A0A6M0S0I5_9CYAN|nr:XRE family transcriptional regulator [Adonisia turfae]NEZ61989.1 XRE family transcriptional regulator [Adonisia turfae CCMR0082]
MQTMKVQIEIEIENLGEMLKEARGDKEPTPVAYELGMTTSNLYRIESEGNKSIPFDRLKGMALMYGADGQKILSQVKSLVLKELGVEE